MTEVYTVFPPNSLPTNIKPMISRPTLNIKLIVATLKGINFCNTTARPAILAIARLLGIIKKYTATATIKVAKVITAIS